jgi:hypothetical protein
LVTRPLAFACDKAVIVGDDVGEWLGTRDQWVVTQGEWAVTRPLAFGWEKVVVGGR